jgi:hypothetical protein
VRRNDNGRLVICTTSEEIPLIVDVNVEEKRKLGNATPRRRVRPRIDDSDGQTPVPPAPIPIPAPIPVTRRPQSVQIEEVPDEDMPDALAFCNRVRNLFQLTRRERGKSFI